MNDEELKILEVQIRKVMDHLNAEDDKSETVRLKSSMGKNRNAEHYHTGRQAGLSEGIEAVKKELLRHWGFKN